MDIIATLFTFTMLWKLSWTLQCYTCDATQTSRPCVHFDHSDKYVDQCERSTMCFKRITTLNFGDGVTTVTIQRGCAQQTTNGEQIKINKKWYAVQNIHEVYNETCSDDPTNAERATKTTHCYCRGDLCNGGHIISTSILAVLVIAFTLCLLS